MKSHLLITIALCSSLGLYSQSTPTTISYDKSTQPGLTLDVPYTEAIAEGAIIQKLREIGFNPETTGALFWKKNTVNGFYVFKNVILKDADGQPVDLLFNVNRKSRQDKERSTISMLVQKDGKFVSSETNYSMFTAASNFLDGLNDYSATFKADTDIKDQEKIYVSAGKKHQQLQTEEQNIQRKIKNLENELSENRAQQENQLKVTEAQKQKLEGLKAKKG